jgi:hypothetical protein
MALRLNPVTGLMEEDGLPEDPNQVAPIAPPVTEFNQVAPGTGAGGGAAPPINVQVGSPDRPIREIEYRTPSPGAVTAEADLATAQGAADTAVDGLGTVEDQEARVRKDYADRLATEKDRALDEARTAETARQKIFADHQAADDAQIEQETKARIESDSPEKSFWEGRPVAEIFTKVLQAIGGVTHHLSSAGGPSPVNEAVGRLIGMHERRLVGRWQATKEANALRRQKRTAYEAELERQRIAAANQSLLSINVLEEQLNAAIAGLSPEKQAAARQVAATSLNEKRAEIKLGRNQLYDEHTKRVMFAPGAGQPKVPLATVADVKEKSNTEASAQQYAELADLIEKNPEAWENYKTALRRQEREDATLGSVPMAGKPLLGLARSLDAATGIGGQTPEQKLVNTGDKVGAEIQRRTEAILFEKAKEGGGTVTSGDLDAAIKRLGAQGSSAGDFAKSLRKTGERRAAEARSMEGVRTFGPNGRPTSPPAKQTQPSAPNDKDPNSWAVDRIDRAIERAKKSDSSSAKKALTILLKAKANKVRAGGPAR